MANETVTVQTNTLRRLPFTEILVTKLQFVQYLFQTSGITIQNSDLFTNFLWNFGDDSSNELTKTTKRNELG